MTARCATPTEHRSRVIYLLFLPTPTSVAWIWPLPVRCASARLLARRTARRVASGQWRLPLSLRRRLEVLYRLPRPMKLRAHVHANLLVVWPDPPLERRLARQAVGAYSRRTLTPEQRALINLLAKGLTHAMVAAELGRSVRWVTWQKARLLGGGRRRSRRSGGRR